MVGIDAYPAPVPPLHGCHNDIALASELLRARALPGRAPRIVTLSDGAATRAAVVAGFRDHLGRAAHDDVALFWFSGHGSRAPGYPALWRVEPEREMQTLVCVDSRQPGGSDLLDKELALLIAEVSRSGCHVVVVLDSCHSGGATREGRPRPRSIRPLSAPPPIDGVLPELRAQLARAEAGQLVDLGERLDHVALQACRSTESAYEARLSGRTHGIFSWALVGAFKRLGAAATYRQLLTAARCEVENHTYAQVPELYPPQGQWADRVVLGGRILAPGSPMMMRSVRGQWEINAGACHGLSTSDGDGFRVAVARRTPVREARVTSVLVDRSLVEPINWNPSETEQFPVVLSEVPLPPCVVAIAGDSPGLVAVRDAITGHGGRPSPHVRLAPADEPVTPDIWLSATGAATVGVRDADHTVLTGDLVVADQAGARHALAVLEHIARWRQVRSFTNPRSDLVGAVAIEVVASRPAEPVMPVARAALRPDHSGAICLSYVDNIAPVVFVRLRNLSDRKLFCVLLDLTDQFRVHADLFPGAEIGPGQTAAALDGRPVRFALAADRRPVPGDRAVDWLKLIVTEEPFDASAFDLPRLGGPMVRRRGTGAASVPGRLGLRAMYRGGGVDPLAPPTDWTTTTLPVITTVPPR
jgi:hypothetical protein